MTFTNLYNLLFENTKARSYSCLMLDLSFLQKDVEKLQEEICPCEIFDEEGYGLENEAHITVCYGLTEQKLSNITDKINLHPCKFRIKNLSLFEKNKYDVLKFNIESDDLHKLNKEIEENFYVHNDYGSYKPHLTVFYASKGAGKKYTNLKSKLIGREFISDRFIFSDATGNKTFINVL